MNFFSATKEKETQEGVWGGGDSFQVEHDTKRIPFLDSYFELEQKLDPAILQDLVLACTTPGFKATNILKDLTIIFSKTDFDPKRFPDLARRLKPLYQEFGGEVSQAIQSGQGHGKEHTFLIESQPLDQLLEEFAEVAVGHISPFTYLKTAGVVAKERKLYSGVEADPAKFRTYLAQLGAEYSKYQVDPNPYVSLLIAAKDDYTVPTKTFQAAFGFETAKRILDVAVQHQIPAAWVKKVVSKYDTGSFFGSSGRGEEKEPVSVLQEIMDMEGEKDPLVVADKIFSFFQAVCNPAREQGARSASVDPIVPFFCKSTMEKLIGEKSLDRVLDFGRTLYASGLGLAEVLSLEQGGKLYLDIYATESGEVDILRLFREMGSAEYQSWDRKKLFIQNIPESAELVRTVGLGNLVEVMKRMRQMDGDPVVIFSQAIPAVGKVFLQELKGTEKTAKQQTPKEKYVVALGQLEAVKEVVDADDLGRVRGQIQSAIDTLAQQEVERLMEFVNALHLLNVELGKQEIDTEHFYYVLGRQKYGSFEEFQRRASAYIRELAEAVGKEKESVDIDWASMDKDEVRVYEEEVQEKRKIFRDQGVDVEQFAFELAGVNDDGDLFDIWNKIRPYARLLAETIVCLPSISSVELANIVERAKHHYENVSCGIAIELKKIQPGKGVRVGEIGGTVAASVLTNLGFKVVYQDAGRSGGMYGAAIDDKEKLVDLKNWKERLGAGHDFTMTNRTFDAGSGVGEIAGFAGDVAGTKELLMVMFNMTKPGGYTLNDDFTIHIEDSFLADIGWREVEGASRGSLKIYKKVEPLGKSKMFTFGSKRVTWDKELQEWK